MAAGIDNSTDGFFGNSTLRTEALKSIAGYFYIGLIINLQIVFNIVLIVFFTTDQLKLNNNTPRRPIIPGPTFWGGLLGYTVGMLVGFRALGLHHHENDALLYKYVEGRSDVTGYNGLELRDPLFPAEFAYAINLLTLSTTMTGIGAANLTSYAFKQCKKQVSTLCAYTAYCAQQNPPIINGEDVAMLDNDVENASRSTEMQSVRIA